MSVKPHTDARLMEPYLKSLDLALVMTVEPGFGGQKFMPEAMPNLEYLNGAIQKLGREMDLEVDGGINLQNASIVKEKGANTLVAGSAVFGAQDVGATVRAFLA